MANDDPFERMKASEARTSIKKVTSEASSLEPDSLIVLYEVDIRDIKDKKSLHYASDISADFLCFHNTEVLKGKKIKFGGKTYYAMPIEISGFEMASTGELPRPRMRIAPMKVFNVEEEQNPEGSTHHNYTWLALKKTILELDNLIGAKVIRIRTFAKYLDVNPDMPDVGQEADPHAQFPREIFYVDSKTAENRDMMEFELASFTDMEGFKLPGRFVLSARCPFTYRGNGCAYEFKEESTDGAAEQKELFESTGHLPKWAPPITTDEDKLISDEMPKTGTPPNETPITVYNPDAVNLADVEEYNPISTYAAAKVVYLKKNGVKYYYVSKGDPDSDPAYSEPVGQYKPPPNPNYWIPDMCSKSMHGCKYRWGTNGKAKKDDGSGGKKTANEFLMFGGFPGTNTRISL